MENTGLTIQTGKSVADTNIININLCGNSTMCIDDNSRNRLSLARWLRTVANELEQRK